jgi:hypothetical protein
MEKVSGQGVIKAIPLLYSDVGKLVNGHFVNNSFLII